MKSPLALVVLPRRSWGWLLLYLVGCGVVLGATAWAVVRYEGDLRAGLLSYIFPDSWHFAADWVIDRFFAAQKRMVVINAINAGALILVTISLFWLKELVSASFERHGQLTRHPVSEHPLWEQAWEEVKLLVLFLAVQMSIFWIGYPPDPFRENVALVGSYLFLFFTFAIDFVSPIFQRHQGHYSRILKTLARHPLASLSFGAIFAMPPILAGKLWEANDDWSTTTAVVVLFSANMISIVWAAIAGTWLGARLLPAFERTPRSHPASRVVAWVALLAVFGVNTYAFGAVGLSIHHKSQILKLDYDVDLLSFDFDAPGLGSLLADDVEVAVSFEVEVHNPTEYDVEIERNRVEVVHGDTVLATTALPMASVPSGDTVELTVRFPLRVKPSMLRRGRELLDPDAYRITLYLEVADGFELPVYLLSPAK